MEKIGATYARRSSEKDDDVGLKAQSIKSLDYATRSNITVPPEYVLEEDDFTGRVADRPVLNKIFALAREGKINCVIVYLVDRWSRDVGAGAELINRIFSLGVELHFVSWGTHVRDTPMDYARYNMEILFSDVERRTIVSRLRDGKVEHAKRGLLIGAGRYVRYGYKRTERITDVGRVKDIEPNYDQISTSPGLESPAAVIHWIFEHIAASKGVTSCCDLLNDTYRISSPGGSTWDVTHIYRLIRSTEYYGQFYYEKRKGRKEQPIENQISIVRPDLALVDRDLWDRANEVLANGKGIIPQFDYLFSRRVTCMNGHRMSCQPSRSRKGSPQRFYYKCKRRKYLAHDCNLPFFRSTVIDEIVFNWVLELLADPEAKMVGIQQAQRIALESSAELFEKIDACNATLQREEKELDNLYADRKKFRTNQRMLQRIEQDIEQTSERIERVKATRDEYQSRLDVEVMSDEDVVYRVAEIERLNNLFTQVGTLEFHHRRKLIELLNIRIVLGIENERQYVDIVWFGDTERKWLYTEEEMQQQELHIS